MVEHEATDRGVVLLRPDECPALGVRSMEDVLRTVRSKSVINSAQVFAGGGRDPENAALNVEEFLADAVLYVDGDTHRQRRKMLNQLITAGSLDAIRDDLILPAADRMLAQLVETSETDGCSRMDLVDFCERVFLHFTAKLIGLVGIDTDEGLARLRSCVGPMMAGTASAFLSDRAAILERAVAAKERYVEEFFEPSRAAMAAMLAEVEAGTRDGQDVPNNLLRLVVTGADPAYANPDTAVIETTIMIAASIGTSTQSVIHTIAFLQDWFRDHPEDYEERTSVPFLLAAIQETIRLRGTFAPYTTRLAAEECVISGEEVRRGQELHIEWPVANRDREVFGDDADVFNPRRPGPSGIPGLQRYGVGFGSGIHQCFGLRVVLGAEGNGGSHVHLLAKLLGFGVRPDPAQEPSVFQFGDIPRYVTYPVLLDDWVAGQP